MASSPSRFIEETTMSAAKRQKVCDDGEENADDQSSKSALSPSQKSDPQNSMDPWDEKKNKEKDILSLREKLQNGLLKPMQRPKRNDLKFMAHCITKLEGYPDLEASIIRSTKINRVLKSIARLEHIPRENKFNFKARCKELIAKYQKTLEHDLKPLYINDPDFVPSIRTFHLFGELPPELKTMTTPHPSTDCRTHATKFGLDLLSWNIHGEILSKLAIPPLLHISRLSREIIWDALHARCFWSACEREVKTSFEPWATYPVEECETEEKTMEAKEEFEEGVDKLMGGMFFLYLGEKRDTGTGRCAVIPDFRVGGNVLTTVAREDGSKKIAVATKEEREAGKVRVNWPYEELGDL